MENRRTPGQAHAKPADRHPLPARVEHVLFQQQRNARGNRVTGFHHVLDELVRIALETPGHGVDIDEALAAKYPYQRAYLPVNRLQHDGTLWNW